MLSFFEFVAWLHHPRIAAYDERRFPPYDHLQQHLAQEGETAHPMTPQPVSYSSPVPRRTAPLTVQYRQPPSRRLHFPPNDVPTYDTYLEMNAKRGTDTAPVEIHSAPLSSQPYHHIPESGLTAYTSTPNSARKHREGKHTTPSRYKPINHSYLREVDPLILDYDKRQGYSFVTYLLIVSVVLLLCLVPF